MFESNIELMQTEEIKRCTNVVGELPNPAVLLRFAGAVLVEQHDEGDGDDHRYFSEASPAHHQARPDTRAEEWMHSPKSLRHVVKKLTRTVLRNSTTQPDGTPKVLL